MNRIPYSDTELQVTGEYLKANEPVMPVKPLKYNYPVTPKENLLAAWKREGALWFPSVGGDMMSLEPRINVDHVARAEVRDLGPVHSDEEKGGPDLFGVQWVYVPVVGGSMVQPGAPILDDVNDWPEIIKFPDIDAMDWEDCARVNAPFNGDGRSLSVTFQNGMFERLISFMDFENAIMALIDEDQQEAVHALFDKLADMYIHMISKYLECFELDGVIFHDDWGSQRAPFFSLDTCMEMIVPHIKKIVDFCHSKGLWFQQHSCGKNEMLVPAMIAQGVDMWCPQAMNDVKMLNEKYGDKIILGVTPPAVAPDASDTEIEAAAKAFVAEYAPTFQGKPIITFDFMCSPKYRNEIYKQSRIALDK
ncbi:MAG: uroporphyrinogen decarboxylase family protein [Clostridiales bacterium]|nr:uroporphyrinogen decarboxylase family protein [Clostridiales bacterium]